MVLKESVMVIIQKVEFDTYASSNMLKGQQWSDKQNLIVIYVFVTKKVWYICHERLPTRHLSSW